MSEILKRLYNACDPKKSADQSQYVDSDKARGSRDLALQFEKELATIKGDFLCFLFSGHLGCGKTSELRHLASGLLDPYSSDGQETYLPILVDMEDYLDVDDVAPTDILLAMVAQVAAEIKKVGIVLKDNFFCKRLKGLKEVLFRHVDISEIETSAKVPLLADVTLRFNVLKRDPTNRKKVRDVFEKDTSTLRDEIRHLFDKARGEIQKKENPKGRKYADFVLILDGLEKINRIPGFDDGFPSHKELFIEKSSQLTGLGAHVVYTIPLPLVLSHGPELQSRYGSTPFVLPMIKVEERNTHKEYPEGYATLKRLLQQRLGEGVCLNSVIEEDARNFLVRYSGGHPRQLVTFVRQAVISTDKEPITLSAARESIADTVAMYSRMLERYCRKLAALELSPKQSIDVADEDIKYMLQQLMIFEYRNGGTEEDAFNPSAPWYAVHPIIRELDLFKMTVDELREERKIKETIGYLKE